MRFYIITAIILLFLAAPVLAAPVVDSTAINGSVITINGSSFGTKSPAAPVYWNNLEGETVGTLPSGWTIRSQPGAVVSTTEKWSGTKSLYFAMKQANSTLPGWCEILRDLGASPNWYWHFKNKIVKNDASTGFQWKPWRISSSSDGYAWNTETTTTIAINDWWYDSTPRWFNASILGYNNAGSSALTNAYLTRTDAIVMGQWQTLEEYVQMSSSPLVTDGIVKAWRDGSIFVNKTDIATHDAGSGQWRYMLLGQAITNITGASSVDFDIYYDDIYIDNTQARVMLCDSSTWNSRNHCEIQIPSAWSDTSITATFNQGSFNNGTTVYAYLIDSTGAASNGYAVLIGSGGSSGLLSIQGTGSASYK